MRTSHYTKQDGFVCHLGTWDDREHVCGASDCHSAWPPEKVSDMEDICEFCVMVWRYWERVPS